MALSRQEMENLRVPILKEVNINPYGQQTGNTKRKYTKK